MILTTERYQSLKLKVPGLHIGKYIYKNIINLKNVYINRTLDEFFSLVGVNPLYFCEWRKNENDMLRRLNETNVQDLERDVSDRLEGVLKGNLLYIILDPNTIVFTVIYEPYFIPCLKMATDTYYKAFFDPVNGTAKYMDLNISKLTDNRDSLTELLSEKIPIMVYMPGHKFNTKFVRDFIGFLYQSEVLLRDFNFNEDEDVLEAGQLEAYRQLKKMREEQRNELISLIKPYMYYLSEDDRIIKECRKFVDGKRKIKENAENLFKEWIGNEIFEEYKNDNYVVVASNDERNAYLLSDLSFYTRVFINNPCLQNIKQEYCCNILNPGEDIDEVIIPRFENIIPVEDQMMTKILYAKNHSEFFTENSGYHSTKTLSVKFTKQNIKEKFGKVIPVRMEEPVIN